MINEFKNIAYCPVCGKEVITRNSIDGFKEVKETSCKSGCFRMWVYSWANNATEKSYNKAERYYIIIFDEKFEFWDTDLDETHRSLSRKIESKIKYWRENDRYLMKLLEG